ncbi:hypothetical protein GCM10011335_53140 [Aureimonas glaciei]|uniref:Uncharacterized protein n=1 Tax=Aureimonas glaciei TaxID=1776957 RepID=A0A917DK29_9HYPH|nr:hypothetical protein GCM10011335_53140 [Aureimonas glaciei]
MRRLVADGVRPEAIAKILGRTPAAVTTHACKLGLRWTKPLSADQIDAIGKLVEEGACSTEIADRLGLGAGRVKHCIRYYGLVGPRSRIIEHEKPFDDLIAAMSSNGAPVSQIARYVAQPASRVTARLITLARHDAVRDHHAGI